MKRGNGAIMTIADHHRAAVIGPREIAYGNGTAVSAKPGLSRDLVRILGGTMDRFAQHSTVVIDGVAPAQVAGQSAALRQAGWGHHEIDAWTLFHRDDGRTVAVGFRDAMTSHHLGVLFTRDTDPGVLALTLDRFSQGIGCSWRGTFATTALAGIRLSWENPQYQPLWKAPKIPARSDVGPISWARRLNSFEETWGFVHTYDANSAYLGSALTAELAWSSLGHVGAQVFDHTLPGYWLVELDTTMAEWAQDPERPPLFRKIPRDMQVWMTTPYAKLLQDLGGQVWVVDSWVGQPAQRAGGGRLHPAGTRVLRKWGESVRDALRLQYAMMDRLPHVEAATKRIYKDAIGGMQRDGMRIFRPDWAQTVIDLWRATLYRKMLRVKEKQGCWPVRISTDSLSYADSSADPITIGAELGLTHCEADPCPTRCRPHSRHRARPVGLGAFKHTATHTVAEWSKAHGAKRMPQTGGKRRGI